MDIHLLAVDPLSNPIKSWIITPVKSSDVLAVVTYCENRAKYIVETGINNTAVDTPFEALAHVETQLQRVN